jgi:uncharacterized membrane protein
VETKYRVAALLHILAAMVWIGGMLFIAMVLAPVVRGLQDPPGIGPRILGAVARRFRAPAWAALVVLVVTGIWILYERGLGAEYILMGTGSSSQMLPVKIALVALVIALSSLHDFVKGPRLGRRLPAWPASGGCCPGWPVSTWR